VFTIDGDGVFAEQTNLTPTGTLETGSITFGTSDQKMGIYAQMYSDPLAGSVNLDLAYDSAPYGHLATYDLQGSVDAGKIYLDQSFNMVKIKFTLNRSTTDPTVGPTMARFELRASPIVGRSREFRIPLMIAEEYGEPVSQTRDVQADLGLLDSLVQTKQPFIYRVGLNTLRLYAADFSWLPNKLTWDRRHLIGTWS
jgi:hypothetical protein